MKRLIWIIITGSFLICADIGWAQNCCAPAVSQQGMLGETTALPYTLEIGLHYEYLRSREMYEGSNSAANPRDKESDWKRGTLTLGYGILPRLSVSAILPYVWKKESEYFANEGRRIEWADEGIGDFTGLVRFSPLGRSFVHYRELSVGIGVKVPTGPVDRWDAGIELPEELWPGTGSWDYLVSLSFYQGFEPADFVLSGTYTYTTEYEDYEFGDLFSYQLTGNYHLLSRLDVSAAISGVKRGHDRNLGVDVPTTGRHQIWFVPGLQFQALPEVLRLQAYLEAPVYQHFNGRQLGSDYNVRFTAVYILPLKHSEDEG